MDLHKEYSEGKKVCDAQWDKNSSDPEINKRFFSENIKTSAWDAFKEAVEQEISRLKSIGQ